MEKPQQIVLLPSRFYGGAYTRTVRNIQQWGSRTVGVVKHDRATWVVQFVPANDHWSVLSGVSVTDLKSKE